MKFFDWLGEKVDEYLEHGARFGIMASRYVFTIFVIPLIIIFFIVIFIISHWNSSILWIKKELSPNKILVEQIGLKESDNIIIKWTCESYCDTMIIYAQNKIVNRDFKYSGSNIFLVYVNDSLVYKQEQYKGIYWQGFQYNFRIIKKENRYLTELKIKK